MLKVYHEEYPGASRSRVRIVPTTTDNRGNRAALNKLMTTTRYPASAVLMELAANSKKMGLRASVEWSPRQANREADPLANRDLSQFTRELRIPLNHQQLQYSILTQTLASGREAEDVHRTAKAISLPTRLKAVDSS